MSANKNMQVKLGELQDYVTLLTTLERKEFEDAAASFFEKVGHPIDKALKKSGIELS